ncbi:MAG: glycosyltransferase family 2 protein [Elusimicrobia bacterium]|nr:glycosyltransferase family 2 protein [Elusimicrobiota bacterium]
MKILSSSIILYFLGVSVVYLIMFAVSFWAIIRHQLRARFATPQEILKARITPPVSVLLPAYNEEKGVVDSVLSLRKLSYPEFEIIVINDGSKDKTMAALTERFKLRKTKRIYHKMLPSKDVRGIYRSAEVANLVVIDKENGGKADALNAGINFSTYPLICSLDADSILENEALLRVIHPFMEAYVETAATGGIVRAVNGCRVRQGEISDASLSKRWLVRFQIVEYLRAFLSGRLGWSKMNALLIISGAFGIFKKEAVLEAGGYRTDTVGEDMELVVRLHQLLSKKKQRYRFHFMPDPVCWTEVPESWRVLSRQRNRWQRGLSESLAAHIGMLFNPRHGWIGLVAMPYFIFVEALSPLVEAFGYAVFLAGALTGTINWESFGIFFSLAILIGILLSLLAILIEEVSMERYPKLLDLGRLIATGILENFGYRQALAFIRTRALWDLARGSKNWGDMERRGMAKA